MRFKTKLRRNKNFLFLAILFCNSLFGMTDSARMVVILEEKNTYLSEFKHLKVPDFYSEELTDGFAGTSSMIKIISEIRSFGEMVEEEITEKLEGGSTDIAPVENPTNAESFFQSINPDYNEGSTILGVFSNEPSDDSEKPELIIFSRENESFNTTEMSLDCVDLDKNLVLKTIIKLKLGFIDSFVLVDGGDLENLDSFFIWIFSKLPTGKIKVILIDSKNTENSFQLDEDVPESKTMFSWIKQQIINIQYLRDNLLELFLSIDEENPIFKSFFCREIEDEGEIGKVDKFLSAFYDSEKVLVDFRLNLVDFFDRYNELVLMFPPLRELYSASIIKEMYSMDDPEFTEKFRVAPVNLGETINFSDENYEAVSNLSKYFYLIAKGLGQPSIKLQNLFKEPFFAQIGDSKVSDFKSEDVFDFFLKIINKDFFGRKIKIKIASESIRNMLFHEKIENLKRIKSKKIKELESRIEGLTQDDEGEIGKLEQKIKEIKNYFKRKVIDINLERQNEIGSKDKIDLFFVNFDLITNSNLFVNLSLAISFISMKKILNRETATFLPFNLNSNERITSGLISLIKRNKENEYFLMASFLVVLDSVPSYYKSLVKKFFYDQYKNGDFFANGDGDANTFDKIFESFSFARKNKIANYKKKIKEVSEYSLPSENLFKVCSVPGAIGREVVNLCRSETESSLFKSIGVILFRTRLSLMELISVAVDDVTLKSAIAGLRLEEEQGLEVQPLTTEETSLFNCSQELVSNIKNVLNKIVEDIDNKIPEEVGRLHFKQCLELLLYWEIDESFYLQKIEEPSLIEVNVVNLKKIIKNRKRFAAKIKETESFDRFHQIKELNSLIETIVQEEPTREEGRAVRPSRRRKRRSRSRRKHSSSSLPEVDILNEF